MLKISNLTKVYRGGKKAVDNISFEVNSGELVGFIGANGAGKTTTLKACCGIHDFNHGEIFINNISIKTDPLSCKKLMSFIPDHPEPYEYLTGIQYINFISDIYKVDSSIRNDEIKRLASLFKMDNALSQLISTYSHGMKQKICLIAFLIHKPKLLLLDEPFIGLDPEAFNTLKSILHELCAAGSAVIFSSHVLDVVEKLCNKIVVIKNGKIIYSGKLDQFIGNETLEKAFLEAN